MKMNRYSMKLFVTSAEENAIVELFDKKNWFLHRFEEDQNITCKNCGCFCFQDSFDPHLDSGDRGIEHGLNSPTSQSNQRLQLLPPIELLSKTRGDRVQDFEQTVCAVTDLNILRTTEPLDTGACDSFDESTRDYFVNKIELFPNEEDEKLQEQKNVMHLNPNTPGSGTEEATLINYNGHSEQFTQEKAEKVSIEGGQNKKIVNKSDQDVVNVQKGTPLKGSKQGNFHCDICNVTFKLLAPFNNHKKDGKCVFTCEYCGKVFTSRYYYNYQVHLKYHRNERSYSCDICGKTYIEKNSLNIHKRKHVNDRPYVCDLCGKCFFSSSHLVYHKKSMHTISNEIHQCDICGAVLSTFGNLKVHKQTVHIAERAFTCEICGKAFKTRKALEQKHAIVHANVFPYICNHNGCNKSFKTAASLNCHVKRHKNQRSHFCLKCGKGFYSKKDLGLYDRVHSGLKPYSCKLCDYTCTLSGNLRKHLKTHE